jgi:hypothetical protein
MFKHLHRFKRFLVKISFNILNLSPFFLFLIIYVSSSNGRAIAQAVSRRLPTAAARVGSNPGLVMWDFVMDKSGAGAGFSPRTSVSPAQSTFHLLLHNHLHYHPTLAQ